ncbi:MAG TPA: O-antigen ligase family protein [Bryobacteraceae bacterium]
MSEVRRRHSNALLSGLLAGYVALLPFQFEAGNHLHFAPADCFLVLVLVFAPGQLIYRPLAWTFWHYAILMIFATGSLVAALRFGSIQRYEVLNKDAGLFLPFLSYVAVTSAITEWSALRRILRVFTMAVVVENTVTVAVFLAAYFFHFSNPFAVYGGLRLSGTMLDPNAYGGLLAAALVICEGASWGRNPLLSGWTLWFSRVTLALGLLFTFSRSAWLALLLGLTVLAVARTAVVMRFVTAALVGVPILFVLMGHRFIPIFEEMASRPKQVQGRFDLIGDGFQAFIHHPLLGGGIGSFRLAEGEVAHNSAMWFLADFGVAGLAVFVGFVGWFFVKGWLAYRFAPAREQPLAIGILAAHASMFGLAMGIEAFYQRHWWLLLGLIAASYSLARNRESQPPAGDGGF